ncbi:MAG: oligosaccharide flippase family protein [Bacteroidales bacterium]
MQRKFLTNLLLLLFLNILVKPVYIFGIDLKVQNLVGPDEYGIFFSMFNFSMLFNILLDFGITNYNNRNISQYKQLLNKHFSGIVTLRLILAVVYTVVSFAIAMAAGYSARQMSLLGFLILNQFLISTILYLRSNIAGLQLFKTDSMLSVLDRVILILLCGFLLYSGSWSGRFTIEVFVWCQTIAYLLAMVTALIVVMRKAAFRRFYWNPLFARLIIRKSFPYAMLTLLMMFYFRVDSVLLERLLPDGHGARQAGIYASAFRLLDAFIMVPYLFSVLLLPMFARMLRFREDIRSIVSIAFPILLVFSLATVALSIGFSNEIMAVLYKEHAAESAAVFRLLIPGLAAYSISYVFGTLLTANGNLWTLNIIAAASMVLNITLNIMLIPVYEALGSAVASCLTLLLAATLQMIISARRFDLWPGWAILIRFLVFMGGTIAVILFQPYLEMSWVYRFVISGAVIVIIPVITGFIRPAKLVQIVTKS